MMTDISDVEFKKAASSMAEFITNYFNNIRERTVTPNVKPGYMRKLLPENAPELPNSFEDIMGDLEPIIMKGVTHWHSPKFHAFYPTGQGYASILADMFSDAIGCIGFTWMSSPASTELEVCMMDWLGILLGLPEHFIAKSGKGGGGVIQGTASESTLVTLLSARSNALLYEEEEVKLKLIAYASDQAHSSVERAAMFGGVKIKLLPTDENGSLRGYTLREAIEADLKKGLKPFYVCATVGTTISCAFDNVKEIGDVCEEYAVYMHIDAAYAGSALLCEEFRYIVKGIEKADSFNFNPHKWMLVNFDCSALWVKNSEKLVDSFKLDPIYLKHKFQQEAPDYRHWQIPLGRRFRSLKLWFTMRLLGAENLRSHIREHVKMAKIFQNYVIEDRRFEVVFKSVMGLVCFRLKGPDELTEELLELLLEENNIFLVPSKSKGIYFLRFVVCSRFSTSDDITYSWKEIQSHADVLEAAGKLPTKITQEESKQNGTLLNENTKKATTDDGKMQNGSVQNGNVKNVTIRNGSVKIGSLQNGGVQTGKINNGSIHMEKCTMEDHKVGKFII